MQSLTESIISKTIEEIRKSELDADLKDALVKLIETTKLTDSDIIEREIYKLAGFRNENS